MIAVLLRRDLSREARESEKSWPCGRAEGMNLKLLMSARKLEDSRLMRLRNKVALNWIAH